MSMNDNFDDGILAAQWTAIGTPTETAGVIKMDYGDGIKTVSSVSGDFDFQIDFLNYSDIPTGNRFAGVEGIISNDDYFSLTRGRHGDTQEIIAHITAGGVPGVSLPIYNWDYGKLRVIRAGSVLTLQYWNGSSWMTARSVSNFSTAQIPNFSINSTFSADTYCEFDNFIANVGSWGILAQASLNQAYSITSPILNNFRLNQKWLLHPLPDLTIPIEAFSGRLKNGEPTYLSVNVPNGKIWADDLAERMDNEIVIIREGIMSDGNVDSKEIVRVNLEDVRLDRGARNSTVSLTGHKTVTTTEIKRVALDGVTYRGGYDGKRHIRCRFDSNIRPGWTACFGDEEFTVGELSYRVGKNSAEMEIVEA